MAAGSEIMGSRKERVTGKMTYGTMLFVSDDGVTGVPVVGTTYFTPKGGSAETGTNCAGRICIEVQDDPEALPGLVYHVATFAAFRAYA